MKLLKIILIFFAIYFIRRLIQAWRVMKQLQETQARKEAQDQAPPSSGKESDQKGTVDAEYKVLKD